MHTIGITAVCSASAKELADRLPGSCAGHHHAVPFGVDYRPRLWAGRDAPTGPLRLTRNADTVFIGLNEAQILRGTTTDLEARTLLRQTPELVVKSVNTGTTVSNDGGRTSEKSETVDVVEPVGTGDSFTTRPMRQPICGAQTPVRTGFGHDSAARVLRTIANFIDREVRA